MSRSRPVLSGGQALVDGGLALAAIALSWSILGSFEAPGGPVPWTVAFLHTAPVGLRRRAPRSGFAISTVAGVAFIASGWPMVALGPAALVLTYSLAAYAARGDSLIGLAVAEFGLLGAFVIAGDGPGAQSVVGNVLMLIASWVLGDGTRRRRELAALYRQRADDLEAAQAELARRAVADERIRIARELHDVVAHSMSAIAVQAGTGRMVIDADPSGARGALEAIERLSRDALGEMRRLLGVLRDGAGDEAATEPAPGLSGIDRLVAQAAAAGTTVDVRVSGERPPPTDVAPGVELAAYRIIQEALTNVRRHAPGAKAELSVDYASGALTITVENDAPRRPDGNGPGLGLIGMRERAGLYGGSVDAGWYDGRFRVVARIPYRDSQ